MATDYAADKIRNVVLLGHSHDGKTTLAEAMLFASGSIPRLGSTDQSTATTDFEPEEQKRKISINLGAAFAEHNGFKINILDAPGFFDFAGQVFSGLRAAEGAVVVVGPSAQLPVGAEVAWEHCNRTSHPRIVVVNKLDKENSDFYGAVAAMREHLSPRPFPLHLPIGSEQDFRGIVDLLHLKAFVTTADGKGEEVPIPDDMKARVDEFRGQLIEAAAESDDSLLEKYLDAGTLSEEEIQRGLREGILEGKVAPVICCSATKLLGVRTLMSTITELMPAPQVEPDQPAKALVFSTGGDQFGRVSYFKVVAGTVKADAHLTNLNRGGDERLAQIFFPRGKEHVATPEVRAGDIGAATKLTHTLTGDTIGVKDGGPLPPLDLPGPAYSVAITPKARGDEEKISSGLARLGEEDPTLHVERLEETKQLVIAGLGDVHLDVTLEKLKRKYGVEATTQVPRVAYRETVSGHSRAEGRHVKQSGGHGQYGICVIEVAPTRRGEGFVWEDRIFGGAIPQNFRASVQKGIVDNMAKGVVAGYPMVDVKVSLVDGKYHSVDSNDMAFQIAGSMAIRKGALDAGPVLLEPIVEASIRVPEKNLGDIMSDINGRRGKILGTEPDDGYQNVHAAVPEHEMLRFALDLRSITQGRGSFSMKFTHYEEMPAHLAKGIIEEFQKQHEAAAASH
ncbi:MAG TPA: elongation factor G [Candidatus Dormibacteraeota bacterium]|nr:elongation factor G [Candidatus Dormibacteraeota bacterium]